MKTFNDALEDMMRKHYDRVCAEAGSVGICAVDLPRWERPPTECYLRVDDQLPDGGCLDVGLEDRDDSSELDQLALEACVERATIGVGDAKELAKRIEHEILAWFPDRYYFAEVWTPGASGIKRYQVIQPAVVGGFRR